MDQEKIDIIRHSAAHVLAAAVLEMFPEAKFGIGPAIENGFYYDFELPRTLIPEDLELIEEKMKRIVKENHSFEKKVVSVKEAAEHFEKLGQKYKVELIEDLEKEGNESVTLYKSGHFVDLCAGPHLESTGEIAAEGLKLMRVSGAYWKSDEKRQQLQRIYGLAFPDRKQLKVYLFQLEEAKKRDHKKIGKSMDLFSFHQEAPGCPFWHPKGMALWNELEMLGKQLRRQHGFTEIQTPIMAKSVLWKTSGHWDHYKDDMFHFESEEETYSLKPMDCPFDILIYKTQKRSYKELPIRYSEIGRVHRNEKSGQLNGLLRVRQITQDDSHILCTPNQIENEIINLIRMAKEYYGYFGLDPKFYLSTRPDDFMGDIESWNQAEDDLRKALADEKIEYDIKEKDGAFYGPKIDIDIKDALGRDWQLATIQLDFQLPRRFEMSYVDSDGSEKTPVMIHSATFGSFERFIGIITEHYAGKFPLWLSPIQVKVIPVSEKFDDYGKKVLQRLLAENIRAEIDASDESLGKRIAEATKLKVPYILVVGEQEQNSESVAARERDGSKQDVMKLDKFIEKIRKEIKERK